MWTWPPGQPFFADLALRPSLDRRGLETDLLQAGPGSVISSGHSNKVPVFSNKGWDRPSCGFLLSLASFSAGQSQTLKVEDQKGNG